jgi:hypothetical protein
MLNVLLFVLFRQLFSVFLPILDHSEGARAFLCLSVCHPILMICIGTITVSYNAFNTCYVGFCFFIDLLLLRVSLASDSVRVTYYV